MSRQSDFQKRLRRLGKEVSERMKRVDWPKVGKLVLVALILLASQGTFGPVAAKYASLILQVAALA